MHQMLSADSIKGKYMEITAQKNVRDLSRKQHTCLDGLFLFPSQLGTLHLTYRIYLTNS